MCNVASRENASTSDNNLYPETMFNQVKTGKVKFMEVISELKQTIHIFVE